MQDRQIQFGEGGVLFQIRSARFSSIYILDY